MEMARTDTDSDPGPAPGSLLVELSCCSCFPCFSSNSSSTVRSSWWERIRATDIHRDEPQWWTRAALKIREWSEVVAGPRWKTFLRRFNKRHRDRDFEGKFQYDPLSYSLNFDGDDDDDDVGFGGFRSFSTRYASVPAGSGKAPAVGAAVAPPR